MRVVDSFSRLVWRVLPMSLLGGLALYSVSAHGQTVPDAIFTGYILQTTPSTINFEHDFSGPGTFSDSSVGGLASASATYANGAASLMASVSQTDPNLTTTSSPDAAFYYEVLGPQNTAVPVNFTLTESSFASGAGQAVVSASFGGIRVETCNNGGFACDLFPLSFSGTVPFTIPSNTVEFTRTSRNLPSWAQRCWNLYSRPGSDDQF
jgi:hypothetical protein